MTLHVAGGFYWEKCTIPEHDAYFGSGGRAAAGLRDIDRNVVFHTYCNDMFLPDLRILAESFQFDVNVTQSPTMYCFDYFHPSSDPRIFPTPTRARNEPIEVNETNVLLFGMVEGEGVVNADKLVYDPQSPGNPVSIWSTATRARKLAIVANVAEARSLSKLQSVDDAGRKLLAEGADVVVVKRGAFGLTVFTAKETRQLPSYITKSVWPIGSGDVFSATFASCWTKFGDAFEAAELASKATASYCETRVLPLPNLSALEVSDRPAFIPSEKTAEGRKQVYLAGPFFSIGERWLVDEVREIMTSSGLKVFSPLHEIGFGPSHHVAPQDIDGLKKSDVLFALLDQYDAGTMFEIGYAKAIGIPVIAYVQKPSRPGITMVEGTDCEIHTDLSTAIYRTVWA